MSNVHKEAHQRVLQCLIAALIVKPLDPGLTEPELQDVVVGSGISIAVFKEIAADVMRRKAVAGSTRVSIQDDLMQLLIIGDGHYPIDLFPRASIAALASAFEELDREFGRRRPKTLSVIISKCAPEPQASVELALGMAVALGFVKQTDGGYVLDRDLDDLLAQPHRAVPHPWVPTIKALIPSVEATIAKRTGSLVPTLSPVDRFHRFLVNQNWSEFATWWALMSREMESAGAYHPTAATVLRWCATRGGSRGHRGTGQGRRRVAEQVPERSDREVEAKTSSGIRRRPALHLLRRTLP